MRLLLCLAFVACAHAGKRANSRNEAQVAEAPPTSDTEATAPPQPAPELAHTTGHEAMVKDTPPPTTAALPPPSRAGAPTITKGKIEVAGPGTLDAEIVTRYLNKSSANFQVCYEKPLLGTPSIAGNLTLVFDIDANGKTTNAKTLGSMNDDVEKCLIEVVTKLSFPKPQKGSVNVSYPMTFAWK